MKRILSLLLSMLMLVSPFVLASCGDKEEQSGVSEESKTQNETSEDEKGFRLEKEDFGGVTITVLTDKVSETVASIYLASEFAPTETGDDPVNDAALNRARLLEEQYESVQDAYHKGIEDFIDILG